MRKADPELHARRRDAIVGAATHCFLKQGFHATSVGDIAIAAEVSMGLLYRYFDNKSAIIRAVAERDTAETIAAVAVLSTAPVLQEALREFIHAQIVIQSLPDHGALIAEIGAEAMRNAAIMELWQQEDERLRAALADAIGRHPDAADATSGRIETLVSLTLALIDGISARAALPGQPPVAELLAYCRLAP